MRVVAAHRRDRGVSATSQREQSAVRGEETLAALAAGNRTYEERFGHVYLVAASGRSSSNTCLANR